MTMQPSDNCVALVAKFEGFSATPYQDVANIWTIGYGHAIKPNESFTEITEDQGRDLLMADLQTASRSVNNFVAVDLNQNQFDALVSFTYNEGSGRLLNSTLLKLVNQGDFDNAANQFGVWIFAGGNISNGLKTRRAAEQTLFQTPVSA